MAMFPTGVGVITAVAGDGRAWGMTCTSLCSVTLRPPTLLACLRLGSPTLRAVIDSDTFALNLLHEEGRPAAELFASGAVDRFARVAWDLPPGSGGPHLVEAAHATADCRVARTEVVGDHMVVFGEVCRLTCHDAVSRPLLYGLRRYALWPED
jgi:flavin reductase (NADH)